MLPARQIRPDGVDGPLHVGRDRRQVAALNIGEDVVNRLDVVVVDVRRRDGCGAGSTRLLSSCGGGRLPVLVVMPKPDARGAGCCR